MQQKTILDRIFDDFVKRLLESGKFSETTVKELDELLLRRELRAEHLKKVIFAPEDVA